MGLTSTNLMGPLMFSKGDVKVIFTRTFQLILVNVTLSKGWKGFIKATFILHLMNIKGLIS